MLFGDYGGQFESVADRWSDIVKSLWVRLKTYRRGDDEFLFDFDHGLYDPKETVQAMVA